MIAEQSAGPGTAGMRRTLGTRFSLVQSGSVTETARNIAERHVDLVEAPLSNQLARASVYGTTVTMLAPALGSEEG